MSDNLEGAPRLWLADLVQADPSAERLGRLVGLGRVEGALIDWRSIAGDQGQLLQVRQLAQAGWDADQTSDALMASDKPAASPARREQWAERFRRGPLSARGRGRVRDAARRGAGAPGQPS
jgi:hypothetical protein